MFRCLVLFQRLDALAPLNRNPTAASARVAGVSRHIAIAARVFMSDNEPTAELTLEEAMADIQTLARFALESGDSAVMKRDLEMILAITEMVLPPRQ